MMVVDDGVLVECWWPDGGCFVVMVCKRMMMGEESKVRFNLIK